MILAIDVGNTNIVIGMLDGKRLVASGRLSTSVNETDDDYAMRLHSFVQLTRAEKIDGAIISSVVPALNRTLKKAVKRVTGAESMIVGPGIKTGINIRIDNPAEMGADLVVGAVAGIAKYPCPQIIFDLGTATTASVIDKNATYLGGAIVCGVKTAINAVSLGTAQLNQVDISAPEKVIATNTADCMKSGAVFGTAALLDGLVRRFERELGEKATVIVTGGLGRTIIKECESDMVYDENLLIDGLRIIYEKNSRA